MHFIRTSPKVSDIFGIGTEILTIGISMLEKLYSNSDHY